MKKIGSMPKTSARKRFKSPLEGDNISPNMAITTTVEIKRGI
jgi:hypothetical protein